MNKIQFLIFLLIILFYPCHGVQAQSLKSGENAVKKVVPSSAKASSYQVGTPIENSFDGKTDTYYHSNWVNSISNYIPITLDYNFSKSFDFTSFTYHPRQDVGVNGNFKEFEVWISTTNNPNYVKIGDYNFNGVSTVSTVQLSTKVKGVKSVRFIVKSGVGAGQGFASCSEMEFYERNPIQFDYSLIFTDASCSELKKGVTEREINQIENSFLKKLAMDIYLGTYNTEFRIQSYKPYQYPEIMKA